MTQVSIINSSFGDFWINFPLQIQIRKVTEASL